VRQGRIVGVGDVRGFSGAGTETIDAGGGLITPGFIDAHVHPVTGGLKLARCSLYDADDADEALAKVADYSQLHPDPDWIWGGGWSLAWFEGGTPSAQALDRVTGNRPAMLYARDGHGVWVNSAALERAGVTEDTADPSDGRIERYPDGSPQGTLHEGAMAFVERVVPPFTATDWDQALWAGQAYLLACGITGWQDADVQPEQEAAYLTVAGRGQLVANVVGALWWERERGLEQIEDLLARRARMAPGYRPTAVKLMLDGIAENFTAAMLEPYRNRDGQPTGGIDFIDGDLLKTIVERLDRLGFQCHFHAIGSRAVRHALDALATLQTGSDRRHHIAHLQVVDPDDVPRFGRLGAIANCQPLWACNEPQMTELTLPFLGASSAANQYPFAEIAQGGGPLAMGSDWPVSTADVYEQVDVAVTRTHPDFRERPPLGPDQSLTLSQALKAFTAGSARVNRTEAERGRIAVGMIADLVVADRNPFQNRPVAGTKVRHTIVGGVPVFSAS